VLWPPSTCPVTQLPIAVAACSCVCPVMRLTRASTLCLS
jgi:hypothetical protein